MATSDRSYIAGSQQSSSSVRSFNIDPKTNKKTAVGTKPLSVAKQEPLVVHNARSTDESIGKWLAVRNKIVLDYPLQIIKVVNGRIKGKFSRPNRRGKSPAYSKSAHIRTNFVLCIDTNHKIHVLTDRGAEIASSQLHHSKSTVISTMAYNAHYINNEFAFVTASTDGVFNIYKFTYNSYKKEGVVTLSHTSKISTGAQFKNEYVRNAHILYKKSAKEYEFYFSTSYGRSILYKGTARGDMVLSIINNDIFGIGSNEDDGYGYSPSSPIVQSFQSNVYFVYLRGNELVVNKKLGDRVRQAVFNLPLKQAQITADNGKEAGTFANGTAAGFYVDDRLINLFLVSDTGYVTLYKIMKGDSKTLFSDLKFIKTFRHHNDSLDTIAKTSKTIKDDFKNNIKRGEILLMGSERYLAQSTDCFWHFFDSRGTKYSAKIDASYTGCYNGSSSAYKAYNKNGFGGIRFETTPDTDTFRPSNILNPEKAKWKDTLFIVAHNNKGHTGFLGPLFGRSFYNGSTLIIYKGTPLHESVLQNVIDAIRPFAFAIVVLVIIFIRYTFKGSKGSRGRGRGLSSKYGERSVEDAISMMQQRINEDESLTVDEKAERLSLLPRGEQRASERE